jgi:hypothetical protein
MIRYIVHLADLHIRANAHGQLAEAFDSLQGKLATLPADQTVVVVCGDIIDTITNVLNAPTIDLVRKLFNVLNHAALRTIVILGNHDAANGCLMAFFPLWSNVTLLLKDSVVVENLRFYVLPCAATSCRPDTDISMPKPQNDLTAVGLYHGPCHPLSSPCLLADPGYELILLGDQHQCLFGSSPSLGSAPDRLGISNPGPHFWHGTGWAYAGSMVQRSRNEAWDDHGMLVWDMCTRSVTFHPVTCGVVYLTIKHLSDDGLRAFDEKGEKWIDWNLLHEFIRAGMCKLSVRDNVNIQALKRQLPSGMRSEIVVTPSSTTQVQTWNFETVDTERFTANDGPGPWKAHLRTTMTDEAHGGLMERYIDDPRQLATGYTNDEKLTRAVDAVLEDSLSHGNTVTIMSVSSRNILGLKNTHVVLAGDGRRLTLLEGPNGSGKSSIIDSIFLCLYGRLPANRHGVDGAIATGLYLRHDSASGSVMVELCFESCGVEESVVVTRTYTRKPRSVECKVSIYSGQHTQTVDWLKARLPPLEDALATSLMNQANDGSLFHLGQARDTGKSTTTNHVRDLFTRLCCLPQLTRYIDLLRHAKKLREDECKRLRQELVDWQGPLTECSEPDTKRAAALTLQLGVARERKRHIDRLCPRVEASAPSMSDDIPTYASFLEHWGQSWMELSGMCNNLLIEVRAHLGHRPARMSETSYEAVGITELQDDAQRVRDMLDSLLKHRVVSQKAGAHGGAGTLASFEAACMEAESELAHLLGKHDAQTTEELLARQAAIPASPEWDPNQCHAVLEKLTRSAAPDEALLLATREALAGADAQISDISTKINATWLQTHAANSRWLWTEQQVARALKGMRQHGDNAAAVDQLLKEQLHIIDRRGDVSCMDRWAPRIGVNAEKCGACRSLLDDWQDELSKLTLYAATTAADVTELRDVTRFFENRSLYVLLAELYTQMSAAGEQRDLLCTRLDKLQDSRVVHAELLQDKQRADLYMCIHDRRSRSKEVLVDAPRAQHLSTVLRTHRILITEYRVAVHLEGLAAGFEGRFTATVNRSAWAHAAVSQRLEVEITELEAESYTLAQAVQNQTHRALVLAKTGRLKELEPERDAIQMMLFGLEVYRSNLMESSVQNKLTRIVTRFLSPLGLGLVGVKDQHKRFKWLVTKDGSTYEHHLASGFEKGIIDFMSRVAMCLVSSSASRFTQLFIDEGLLAADVTNRAKLGDLINQISHDFCGIIMVSHMTDITDTLCEATSNVVRVAVSPTLVHRGSAAKKRKQTGDVC